MAAETVVNVLVGGFCSSPAGYEPLRAEMEQACGSPVVFVGSNRWRNIWFKRNRQYPRAMYRQALYVAQVLQAQGITRARLFGHSMGGMVSLIVADAFPELVEDVVLLNSAGIHVGGVIELGRRFKRKAKGDLHDAKHHPDEEIRAIVKECVDGAWVYLRNIVRSIAEGIILSRYTALTTLHPKLSSRNIPVFVAYGTRDTVYLEAKVLAVVGPLLQPDRIIELPDLPHDVQYHPKPTVAALKAAGLL